MNDCITKHFSFGVGFLPSAFKIFGFGPIVILVHPYQDW